MKNQTGPSGNIVGVFGLPCSGKSTIINALISSSRTLMASISSGDIARRLSTTADTKHMADGNLFPFEGPLRAEILSTIDKRRIAGAEVIFLEGFPRTVDQIHWLLDNGLAGYGSGCLIKIEGDNLFERAVQRNRDFQDDPALLKKKIDKQAAEISKMEELIFKVGIPYQVIMNVEITNAVQQFAKYLGIRK